MREIITATGMKKLNIYLAEKEEIKVIHADIDYQEELFNKLAVLEPDVLLVKDTLPGPLSKWELSEELVKMNKKMKIIFILFEGEDTTFTKHLKSIGINACFEVQNTNIDEDLIPEILFQDPEKEELKEIIKNKEIEEGKESETEPISKSEKIYIKKEIFSVVSPGGGGVGKSTISVNLGVSAAVKNKGAKIIIIDFSEEKADIARFLNLPEEKGLAALSKAISREEFHKESILLNTVQHSMKYPNLYIYSGIKELIDAEVYTLSHYRYIIEVLKEEFDLLIIDTGYFKSAATHAAIEKATKILFVVRDNESCLDSLNRKIKFYENDLTIPIKNRMEIFMNMTVGVEDLNDEGIKEIFNQKPIANIPFNEEIVFETEKYLPFVLNEKKYKNENKEINNVITQLFKYQFEETKNGFFTRIIGGRR